MNQPINEHTPPDRRIVQGILAEEAPFWQLESDRQLLKHLYAQREEQVEQLGRLENMGASERDVTIVQGQLAMLDHAIRQAEEQASLHERLAKVHLAGQ